MAAMPAPAAAASELVANGRKSAASLRAMLGQQPAVGGAGATPRGLQVQDLIKRILRCCDRALAALRSAAEDGSSARRKRSKPEQGAVPTPATSSSSKRMRLSGGERATRAEKRRTMEDGFVWRKYGQKDIHGSKHPRLYFRCTYKDDHGCMARRQVQRSEADPSVYLINYFGDHTCCRDDDAAESPAPFVINFGASTRDGQQLSGSPWSSSACDDDGGLVISETSDLCHSPEEKAELRAVTGNVPESSSEQSTPPPVPELTSMSSPEWDPLYGCLVWDDIGLGESLLFDDIIGEFAPLDYVGLFQ